MILSSSLSPISADPRTGGDRHVGAKVLCVSGVNAGFTGFVRLVCDAWCAVAATRGSTMQILRLSELALLPSL